MAQQQQQQQQGYVAGRRSVYLTVCSPDQRVVYTGAWNVEQKDSMGNEFVIMSNMSLIGAQGRRTGSSAQTRTLQFEQRALSVLTTPSGYRLIMITYNAPPPKQEDVQGVLTRVSDLLVQQLKNPLYRVGEPIADGAFARHVASILSSL